MEESNRISKHIELTVNVGNFSNVKIGTFLSLEIEAGESLDQANARVFDSLRSMLRLDIDHVFSTDSYLRQQALSMIGVEETKTEAAPAEEDDYDPEEDDDDYGDYNDEEDNEIDDDYQADWDYYTETEDVVEEETVYKYIGEGSEYEAATDVENASRVEPEPDKSES